jgi:penicillin-binding protein 1A
MAQRFGFAPEELPENLTIALGSGTTIPLRMSAAYAVFANGGHRVKPYLISEVRSVDDQVVLQAAPSVVCQPCEVTGDIVKTPDADQDLVLSLDTYQKPDEALQGVGPQNIKVAQRILSPQVHYQISSILRDVIKRGTGRKAMQLGRNDLAGKTGTTNEQRDAWFNGFHPELVATAWVGFDELLPLGRRETGGRAALPMWISFMEKALKGKKQVPLAQPVGMVTIRIDPDSGLALAPGQPGGIVETFRKELVPAMGDSAGIDSAGSGQPIQSASDSEIRENLF